MAGFAAAPFTQGCAALGDWQERCTMVPAEVDDLGAAGAVVHSSMI